MSSQDLVLAAAGASAGPTYIEDVFSTYLYTGNGSTQTITNGIDLAGKGGVVWIKSRSAATSNHVFDTTRDGRLFTDLTSAQGAGYVPTYFNFNSDGFYLDAGGGSGYNNLSATYASWTFRKAPKFFDVVTYTGDGVAGHVINHSLGTPPGMMIIKRTDSTSNWYVYSRGLPNVGDSLVLNTTDSVSTNNNLWSAVSSTSFTLNQYAGANAAGGTYVAYLFAHDTTTDGLIQCGSYTGNGSATGPTINLGWEPQYVLIKGASLAQDWFVADTMRGMPVGGGDVALSPNSSSAEMTGLNYIAPTATGFQINSAGSSFNGSGETYIYMAIRRGPMKTPTDGTKVFAPVISTGSATLPFTLSTGITPDLFINKSRGSYPWYLMDRFRGDYSLASNSTSNQNNNASLGFSMNKGMNSVYFGGSSPADGWVNASPWGGPYITYSFKRAPGFFDVVCYTGTGAIQNINHNLGVAPELMIVKSRSSATNWYVGSNFTPTTYVYNYLNQPSAASGAAGDVYSTTGFSSAAPTASSISCGSHPMVGASGTNYVAYLFASCPGVSKVGSYTGNGTSQTINCGFTNGARFVLIKRTDSTGDWYVWDTARGIVAGNDPHLSLNTVAAEVTSDDTVDPDASGFIVNQDAATNVNVSGASYIYLAIA